MPVASDGYARCWFNPFGSRTGRNQPSSSKYIFSMPKWTRALIKPPPGYGFAYLDFEQQEIMAAAGLSGDEALMKDATEGDPYLAFAVRSRLAPRTRQRQHTEPYGMPARSPCLGVPTG